MRARGGTRNVFQRLQTLGGRGNMRNPGQSGSSTSRSEAKSVDTVHTSLCPFRNRCHAVKNALRIRFLFPKHTASGPRALPIGTGLESFMAPVYRRPMAGANWSYVVYRPSEALSDTRSRIGSLSVMGEPYVGIRSRCGSRAPSGLPGTKFSICGRNEIRSLSNS